MRFTAGGRRRSARALASASSPTSASRPEQKSRCTVEHVTEKSFTPRMSQVFGYASAMADQYGHDHIGTEHVLLGLLASNGGVARHVLEELGVADEAARRVRSIIESDGYTSTGD
jgi:ATP-dependent Clp protease ATP-binding subunit ClpA